MPTDANQNDDSTPSILNEFRAARGIFYRIWGPAILVTLTGFAIAFFFIEPAPPRILKIAAGPADGSYYAFAQKYAETFDVDGVELEIIETAGSIENYRLLAEDNDIDLAIVQGGTKPDDVINDSELESIASLYLEPLWIFNRGQEPLSDIRDLTSLRTDCGSAGSGTSAIIRMLLEANGLGDPKPKSDEDSSASTQQVGGEEAVAMLLASEIDAACFVLSARHPLPAELASTPDIHLMPLTRSRAYSQIFPFLSDVVLPKGALDLKKDLPRRDTPMIAPAANLVCTPELHDAFVPLLLNAASVAHSQDNLLVEANRFPSLEFAEFQPNAAALDYFQAGPPFLNRYLPFWPASLLNRGKILLLPMITLLFPLLKIAPPVYRWRIRSRIYRWYFLLRELDQELDDDSVEDAAKCLKALNEMETELRLVKVPLSYMAEFYHLRLHIDLLKRRLDEVTNANES